ncbi:MAG: hypothetical protein AABX54_03300 [Nanoarchaeota archaeon]
MKEKIRNSYDEELERLDNIEYAKRVIGDKSFLRNNPEYITIELQRRTLRSQTPKWINVVMLILVALTLIISLWTLLHHYRII